MQLLDVLAALSVYSAQKATQTEGVATSEGAASVNPGEPTGVQVVEIGTETHSKPRHPQKASTLEGT